jgi:aminotransferase
LNPGDEVIYHEPCYVSYSPSIKMAYGVPVVVQTREENEFALMAADVEKAITPKTKVIAMNFPTNPTGGIMPQEELEKIAALAVKHDLLVFTDEIYSELLYDGRQHKSIVEYPGMRERTVLLHGFSKAFAMTGWRLGYACAPAPLREAMMKIHQYCMLCAPIMSQMAGIEALKMGESAYEDMRQSYEQRRNLIVSRLNGMGLHCFNPGGAFYVFPDIRSTGLTSKEFAIQLLEKKSVAVVPWQRLGSSAGEGFVRCCYATAPELIVEGDGPHGGVRERSAEVPLLKHGRGVHHQIRLRHQSIRIGRADIFRHTDDVAARIQFPQAAYDGLDARLADVIVGLQKLAIQIRGLQLPAMRQDKPADTRSSQFKRHQATQTTHA